MSVRRMPRQGQGSLYWYRVHGRIPPPGPKIKQEVLKYKREERKAQAEEEHG